MWTPSRTLTTRNSRCTATPCHSSFGLRLFWNRECASFDIAHGSALECAAGLGVLVAKGKFTVEQVRPGKERLQRIVRMLVGLIKRHATREYEKHVQAAPL